MSGTGNNPRHPTRVPSQWAGVAALLEQHEIVVFDAANGGYDVANRRNREQALGMPVPQAIRTPTPTLLRLPLRLRLPLPLLPATLHSAEQSGCKGCSGGTGSCDCDDAGSIQCDVTLLES